jgi:undecaprenyl-diphosphatase
MKKKVCLWLGVGFLAVFVLWTVLVSFVDVRAIGPQESSVGFAVLNSFVHEWIGVNMFLYTLTDWLGLVPIAFAIAFAVIGLIQWIKRKKLLKVDGSILALGVFYLAVLAVYLFFEFVEINSRPVLINGVLETSYPSSTTMLASCIIPTTILQVHERIPRKGVKWSLTGVLSAFTVFMVVGRVLSGVHWITDIIGGLLFSVGIVALYVFAKDIKRRG